MSSQNNSNPWEKFGRVNNNGKKDPIRQENSVSNAQQISLPKGGGAVRGLGEKFSADPFTGTFSISIPIFTTPGRSDFYPKLSLSMGFVG